jgi:uracil-DNA glycosylase
MNSFALGLNLLLQQLRNDEELRQGRFDQSMVERIRRLTLAYNNSGGLPTEDSQRLSAKTHTIQPSASSLSPVTVATQALDDQAERLATLRERVLVCEKCAHLAAFRQTVVFGVGNPSADLMFVGEAPGADEDLRGEPFVGRAGELLTRIIETMGFKRETVYIANVLKCRPDIPKGSPGNRQPTPEEMQTCLPYLRSQIEIIQPKVMVALGGVAMRGLFGTTEPMRALRGRWHQFGDIPVMATFHPSYLLRNQSLSEKRKVWEDMLQVLERLGCPISERQRNFFLPKNE